VRFRLVNYNGPDPTCFPCRQATQKRAAAAAKAAVKGTCKAAKRTWDESGGAAAPPPAAAVMKPPPAPSRVQVSVAAPPAAAPAAALAATKPPTLPLAQPPAAKPAAAVPPVAKLPPVAGPSMPRVPAPPRPPPILLGTSSEQALQLLMAHYKMEGEPPPRPAAGKPAAAPAAVPAPKPQPTPTAASAPAPAPPAPVPAPPPAAAAPPAAAGKLVMRDCRRCGEPAWLPPCTPMAHALCPAHAANADDADEATTLDELVGAAAPTSPKIKVEPAEQLSTWAPLPRRAAAADAAAGSSAMQLQARLSLHPLSHSRDRLR
jgi:hypothetical protein